mmetsp:Transcript_38005/g.94448  ORF Transcript_38005/g.94448 Transcript_38005/m.94448 type:complete len:246 (+) Transcript_38005:4069-4806(+)
MKSSRRRPTTSHFDRPVMCVAFRFHSVTSEAALMPKMGALAQSISRMRSCTSCEALAATVTKGVTLKPTASNASSALVPSPTSLYVLRVNATSSRSPSEVTSFRVISDSLPSNACSAPGVCSSATASCVNGCPTAVDALHPVSSVSAWFHSITTPFPSHTNAGAGSASRLSVSPLPSLYRSPCDLTALLLVAGCAALLATLLPGLAAPPAWLASFTPRFRCALRRCCPPSPSSSVACESSANLLP